MRPERDAPGGLLRRLSADQLIGGVEVEQEAERSDADADEAEDDGDRSTVTQAEAAVDEEARDEVAERSARQHRSGAPMIMRVRRGVTRMAPVL